MYFHVVKFMCQTKIEKIKGRKMKEIQKTHNFYIPVYKADVQMFIGGFCSPAVRLSEKVREPVQGAFDDAAELGITHLIPDHFQCDFGDAPEEAIIFLDRAQRAGVKVFVYDTGLGSKTSAGHTLRPEAWDTSWAKIYTKHPAFAGVHFQDEPRGNELSVMASKQKKWREEFPDKLFFINLYPGYAGEEWLGGTFKSYIDNFINTAKPDLLSFDHYPLLNDCIRPHYFQELATVKQAAKKAGIPAHAYVLSAGHACYRRNLSLNDLRWQIAVIMAFGFEAFSHYPAGADYNGYDKIISETGERTDLWYNIQAINLEVKKWAHVYLAFKWEGTVQIPGSHRAENPRIFKSAGDEKITCDAIPGVKIIPAENLLCGVFKDNQGNKGYMLTNATDPNCDRSCLAIMIFEAKYKGVQVFEKGEPKVIALDKNNKISVELEPSEGKFVIPLKKIKENIERNKNDEKMD